MNARKSTRGILAGLLVASAAMFAIGVAFERWAESDEAAVTTEQTGEAGHSEAEEGSEGHAEGEAAGGSEVHTEDKETLLGIDIESPVAVGAGVFVSMLLAALAFRSNNRIVLGAVALFALGFAVLDGRELFHQLDENRTGLAVLAGVIALLHLGAAVVAGREARAVPAP